MRKRGRDECLFQYSRITSVSPHIVCFLTSQRAPGRWDRDSNTRHCTRYDECLRDAGWMSELMDIQNRSALNITPNSSRPATQTFGPSWKMWAIFLSHSGTKKGIGFFSTVPSPKGTETWSFNKKLIFAKIIELAIRLLFGDWIGILAFLLSITMHRMNQESYWQKKVDMYLDRQSSLIRAILIFSLKCLSEALKPLKLFFFFQTFQTRWSQDSQGFPSPTLFSVVNPSVRGIEFSVAVSRVNEKATLIWRKRQQQTKIKAWLNIWGGFSFLVFLFFCFFFLSSKKQIIRQKTQGWTFLVCSNVQRNHFLLHNIFNKATPLLLSECCQGQACLTLIKAI